MACSTAVPESPPWTLPSIYVTHITFSRANGGNAQSKRLALSQSIMKCHITARHSPSPSPPSPPLITASATLAGRRAAS